MLDITPLKNAANQLEQSLIYTEGELAKKDPKLHLLLRAAAIQAFEFTFELSIKMLERQLNIMAIAANIDKLAYRDLLRVGAEKGLIDNPVVWFDYREKRNITSHTYDIAKAELIYKVLPEFLRHVRSFIKHLEAKQ